MIGWLQRREPHPLEVSYRASLEAFRYRKVPALKGPVAVIDTETSGFRIGSDRILSAALLVIENGNLLLENSRAWLVRQEGIDFLESSEVHCLVPADLEQGVPEPQFLEELLSCLHGRIVVGHHIHFDIRMLDEAMRRNFGIKWRNPYIDTAQIAAHELPAFHRTGYVNQPLPGLDDVCSEVSLYPMERHSAWGDAFTTAEIYLLLCARMRQRIRRPVEFRDLPVRKA